MEPTQMTPRRPYLLRAFYDWLLDNQLTPHLVVDVSVPGISVPMEFARDGQIILNIAPHAVGNLELGNDDIRFNARFGGIPRHVHVPMAAVLAIYARENGAGTMFEPEPEYLESAFAYQDTDEADSDKSETGIHLVSDEEPEVSDNGPGDDEPPQPPRGRPALRVVK
ncbi:ClpXP protease specificity-enhancing factor [Jinshanibacter sp. LJY008]|uniref:Stringent starvation protein B n=1 Tax=Limnobaculum eriocheiris TaxID=2897391 RepID=A0A9X1MWD0_9GAMM|nr:ClpXP protease specificity-enhancing factor [Limnobaculum eriocheiris]MCD1124947.1 ClpXP protease specificity-enhancing factor [Limnobaculum eriocheiris]